MLLLEQEAVAPHEKDVTSYSKPRLKRRKSKGLLNREGDADMANKACLRSNLAKKWGDVSTIRGRYCRG